MCLLSMKLCVPNINFLALSAFCDRQPDLSPIASFGVTMTNNGTSKPSYRWRRVLLKVSGEALAGDQAQNIDPKVRIVELLTYLRAAVLFCSF